MKKLVFITVCLALVPLGCDGSTSMATDKGNQNGSSSSGTGDNGQNGGDNGQNGGDSGQNGGDNGQNGGDNGQNGGDNGQNGGDNGQNGGDNGQNGGDSGQNGGDNGQDEEEKPDLPYDVVGGIASGFEGLPCTEGERYCDLTNYAECQNNRYIVIEKCADNAEKKMCINGYGCSMCEPDTTFCKDDGNDIYACSSDGSTATFVKSCVSEACSNGSCEVWGCPVEAQFIYLVDSSYHLVKFNPGDTTGNYFTELSQLNCTKTSTPYSMAVDREANAWVLYQNGILYKVNIATNTCEEMMDFTQNGSGLTTFGMGFSLDKVGGSSDTLYIAEIRKHRAYGKIDTSSLTLTMLAPFSPEYEIAPELTGTGLAKLYSYVPGTSKQYIEELDKTTGKVLKSYPLPGAGGSIGAWAFAHWGGYFFVFYSVNGKNNVYRYSVETGAFDLFYSNSPYRVVGAGVSTCAPVEIN